jgi:serine/threonine protein kinase
VLVEDDMASDRSASGHSSGATRQRVVRMGQYEIGAHIASGGMGHVYRGRDLQNERDVALKILSRETAAQPAMLERFRREARSASKLQHENIVTVYDHGEIGGAYFLAMEYIDGIDLHDYVKRKGPLDPEEARLIILQGARALEHAASHRIVHRDIKPSNFLVVRKQGQPLVKLTDFGLAREISPDEFRVTRAGTTVGTVDYMSPEQARDSSAADIRSDLYSLGSTWYHLLTGQAPFPDGGLGERLIKIMTEKPPDPRELNPHISDQTWGILSRLLEKEPGERFQTPRELIKALVRLEGSAARLTAAKGPTKKPRQKAPDDTRAEAPTTVVEKPTSKLPYILAAVLGLLVVGSILTALSMPKKQLPSTTSEPSSVPAQVGPVVSSGPDRTGAGQTPVEPVGPPADAAKSNPPVRPPLWPVLSKLSATVDLKALREEVEKPWAERALATAEPFVVHVGRSGPTTRRTLADAVAAAPEGRAIVVEVHDNGPLFELPVVVEGRNLTLRAGKGYRPLLLWDLPATVEQRRRDRKTDTPLAFLTVRKGNLHVEGVELALRWPEGLAEAATFLDVRGGDLEVRDCTVSVAGKPREEITLARMYNSQERTRCRFTRLFARGSNLAALELDATDADLLLDGCLVVGGQPTLLRLRADGQRGPRVRLVRSTLVCNRNLLEVKPVGELDRSPVLRVLAWDSLLSRAGAGSAGDLFTLHNSADTDHVEWRAVHSLYAGWKHLLTAKTSIAGDSGREWRSHWKRTDGDEAVSANWPEQPAVDAGSQPALALLPGKTVGFGSSVDPDKPLGCDLSALPPCRDGWLNLALDPLLAPIDLPSDSSPPEIPNPGDGRYHGGRIDLATTDLGMHLARVLATTKPGPRIVLHLTGKGEHACSPIQLKGTSLVLFFEEPADNKKPRTALKLSTSDPARSLIEVEDGSVEIVAGVLRLADLVGSRGAHLVRIKGGDVKLYRTRLEGPQVARPLGWRSALALTGSGEAAAERARVCALNECVVLSGQAGVVLEGTGSRLALRQSLVVAGTDAMQFLPGAACKGRANIQATLQQSTLAARGAIVRLSDAAFDGPPADPVVVTTRDCAFLNPFLGQKAGLVVAEGTALSRGLLLWQGERDALDTRLHFMARAVDDPLPVRREGLAAWQRLWGSVGVKHPRPEVGFLTYFDPRRWALDRLILRMRDAPGADLDRLGIGTKKKN